MMRFNRIVAMVVSGIGLLALVGCGGSGESEKAAVMDEGEIQTTADVAVELRKLSSEESALIQRVTEVAKAIEAAPERAALILAEHDISADKWTEMLSNIAKDPALAAAFEDAMER